MNNIGERIKRNRLQKSYTLDSLAQKIGTSKQTIHRYETGIISNIPSDKIEALAKALDVTPAYLMGWEDLPGEQSEASPVPLHTATLRADEAALLGSYNKLNDTGKEKAAEYVTDLSENKKYTSEEDMGRMSS